MSTPRTDRIKRLYSGKAMAEELEKLCREMEEELPVWKLASEEMPPVGKRVLAFGYDSNPNYPWRFIAKWQPAGTLDAKNWDDPPAYWWNEEEESCLCPFDAWWESPYTTDNCSSVEHVTHWMELPKPQRKEGE